MGNILSGDLHPHQLRALEAIERALAAGATTVQIVMATGTGKSAVIGHAVARLFKAGRAHRALFLTPVAAVAEQMAERLRSLDLGEDGLLGDAHYVHVLHAGSAPDNRDGTVTIATHARLRSLIRNGFTPDFDLVVLDQLEGGTDWPETATTKLIYREHVTIIAFSSRLPPHAEAASPPAFTYDIRAAIADGVLVNMSRRVSSGGGGAWPTFDPQHPIHSQRHIFLGGVDEDHDAILKLAGQLRAAGIRIADTIQVQSSDVPPGDVIVAVLSRNSIQMPLAEVDVSRALERRGVDVVPAVIEYCAIPAQLAGRLPVDVTGGADGLLRRLQASAMVDLDSLAPARFENLVADLLTRLDFTLAPSTAAHVGDSGVDFLGTHQDVDGFGIATKYLIQVKLTRSSFRDVDGLLHLVRNAGQPWRGMVVTNGHLTSVTEKRLARAWNEGLEVQVVDGPRLRSLLLRHPDLIVDHFARR